jgi:hypothetical protein
VRPADGNIIEQWSAKGARPRAKKKGGSLSGRIRSREPCQKNEEWCSGVRGDLGAEERL